MAQQEQRPQSVLRFHALHRLLHLVVMLGFIGLGITGFSLKFSGQFWAQAIAWLCGGQAGLAWLHRACAVATYAAVMLHLLWLLYYKLARGGRLTGPRTMFPRLSDLRQLGQHIAWFMGSKVQPKFDRFTYWEKADYWAVLLGMNTMGLTGLVLWFPEWFTRFMPGYFVNLAFVLHFYEALLAVALKFVSHIITAHLRPEVYPMDRSIFSGHTSLERLKQEHAGQWEAMAAEGEEQ